MSGPRKPPARRRKRFLVTAATGQVRLAPDLLDATAGARMISVAILFLIALAAVELTMDETFYVQNPLVVGNQRVPAAEIIAASEIVGWHVLWLQSDQAETSLQKKMPELQEASVWCGLPAECTIQVVERQPVLEWKQGQTRMWVDADGVAFPARGQLSGVPVVEVAQNVTALLPGHKVEAGLVHTMLALAKVLPEVRSYRFTPERGIEFSDPKGNWPVILGLGTEADVIARVTMWRALASSLASRNIRPKFVDVHYPNAPFYGK